MPNLDKIGNFAGHFRHTSKTVSVSSHHTPISTSLPASCPDTSITVLKPFYSLMEAHEPINI